MPNAMRAPTSKPPGAIPRWTVTAGARRRVNLDLPIALADRLRALAHREDVALSDVVRTAIAAGLPHVEAAIAKSREAK